VTEPDDRCRDPEARPADRWLRILLEDSLLWPVLLAGAGIVVTSGAGVLLMALRGRSPFVWVPLVLLAAGSCDLVARDARRRRFGLLSRAVVGVWLASAGAAALALWLGLA